MATFKIPNSSERWRHYKGDSYRIVGMAMNENGTPTVVYESEAGLFTRSLGSFLERVNLAQFAGDADDYVPRFTIENEKV